ncbi:MAG: DUF3489 domain-containing protein [Acidobacteriota bacterium]|nr:DUF3489 domain-containing protein [Acidobacteriota bacterium]
MKTFTIENETNITAHATPQDAESVPRAERFTTAAALAALAADWAPERLVAIWNSLPGARPVTKFQDRKTAVKRIWKVIQGLGEPVANAAPKRPHAAPVNARPRRKTTRSKPKPQSASKSKGTRPGSKTTKILDLLRRPDGVTLQQIMKATGWQAHSVRGFLSGTLGKKMGLTVLSAKTDDGTRVYSIQT